VQEGGAALAAILMYTAPVWVAIAARLVFKEELTRRKQLAIWVSLAGVVCISLSGNSGLETISFAAVFFGLASGLLYSGHYIFSKLYLEYYSPFALYGIAMLSAALVSFPFMSVSLDRLVQVWLPLLYLCVVCSYVSYWAYCDGLKRVESTKAVVLATIDPMVGIFVAWLWWGEFFSPAGWVGTIMIVVAVLIIVMERGKGADTQADSAARP
jgi:drug/metabolite transporter (DMT)-like permease